MAYGSLFCVFESCVVIYLVGNGLLKLKTMGVFYSVCMWGVYFRCWKKMIFVGNVKILLYV